MWTPFKTLQESVNHVMPVELQTFTSFLSFISMPIWYTLTNLSLIGIQLFSIGASCLLSDFLSVVFLCRFRHKILYYPYIFYVQFLGHLVTD